MTAGRSKVLCSTYSKFEDGDLYLVLIIIKYHYHIYEVQKIWTDELER